MSIPTIGTNLQSGNALDVLNNFVSQVGNFISQAFREIVYFLHSIQLIFLDISFILIVLLFFLLLFLCVWFPIWFNPYFLKIKALFFRFFEGLQGGVNRDK
jgi:hypothetical protein